MPYVYMLECSDGSYYVGSTWDLERRVAAHASGEGAKYTNRRRPVRLVWFEEYDRVDEAWAMERRVHGWGRDKREALVRRDYDALPELARGRSRAERGQRETASNDNPGA